MRFLTVFYPDFEINFDDASNLIAADYIYFYSLLLHFCCVKKPLTPFHEICQRLPSFDQQCIASFFKQLLDVESVTKEALCKAIAAVGDIKITPSHADDSISNNIAGLGMEGSSGLSRGNSPLKTPNHCTGFQRNSPSTPKSFILEERTRELYNLRVRFINFNLFISFVLIFKDFLIFCF